jgi:DNA-binding CsgD family transcriptional regulator
LPTTLRAIASLGTSAAELADMRAGLLGCVRAHVPFDAGLLHELSPRASLGRAGLVAIDPGLLARTLPTWDALAVELGRLRDVAMERGGVASDTDAFPARSSGRRRWKKYVEDVFGLRHGVFVHLVVRERIVSVAALFRERELAPPELEILRKLAPALSCADALGQSLAGGVLRGPPTRLRCEDQRLTARQREIVVHVALGQTNAAIADAMSLSPNTVRNLLADATRRVGASNRAEIVRLAVLR